MLIGVPKEIKPNEKRVALTPGGVEMLRQHGHDVIVETNGGVGSGFTNDDYIAAGAKIIDTAAEVYAQADMIMKVKEPIAQEYGLIRKGQTLFTYFHFAASRELTEAMVKSGAVCLTYETVQKADGSLPLLIPMSEVAGRMAPQEGAKYLEHPMGGRGVLLGGVPGTKPANVIVLGGGIVGTNAAKIAAGFGARVTIFDNNLYRLRYLDDVMPKNCITQMSTKANIREAVKDADLVIGAVLVVGAKAPHLVTRDMLKTMKEGSVIVDVSVDQGGCVETCKPTTHENPTYVVDGVVHYGVANMPGAVPYTSTIALTNATLPYAVQLANQGWKNACKNNSELVLGLNVVDGKIVYEAVAEAFGMPYTPVESVL
ncbi:MAG: alanine dehydrogenase [Ignavibacteria bacterium]|nr:alanine dehydrogenase [Ignavibacteria bacterium]MBP7093907.1 alanine dehydrogenase [Candidatus Kapabacteria bacterium]MBK6420412.1 alanine dehydrogenase [Ignavibacteria bacterium]MBK6761629.1 alanine dehydrogenase [Ignavibacteria bacterium]MBK7033661.1 alanine dehydrogenase [Ignavibacteria bacterium]